jgi:hypothetical protein
MRLYKPASTNMAFPHGHCSIQAAWKVLASNDQLRDLRSRSGLVRWRSTSQHPHASCAAVHRPPAHPEYVSASRT